MRSAGFALPLFLAAISGCAGNVTAGVGDAEATTTTSAVVVVERSAGANDGVRAEGSARFVRVSAPVSVDDALRAIGAALDLPARGTCASITSLSGGLASSEPAPFVELVDVGAVSLVANGVNTSLVPRQLPDVTDVVTGVVYARAVEAAGLPAGAHYSIHVAGSARLAPFDVEASAPGDPAAVVVGGEDVRGTLSADGPTVELSWTPDSSDDSLYVDVRPSGVRCVFGDVGHAAVPTVFFNDSGALVVHRLHREPLRAQGIDSGEIRFDFARSVAYVRR